MASKQRPGAVTDKTAVMLKEIAAHPMITGFATDTHGGVDDMTTVSDAVDGSKIAFDQNMLGAWSTNVKALGVQISQIKDALGVILVKVTGEAVVEPTPVAE